MGSSNASDDRFRELRARFDLTPRETELARSACSNKTAKRIADDLFLSPSTVYTHLKRIYRKCGVHSRQELIDLIDSLHES